MSRKNIIFDGCSWFKFTRYGLETLHHCGNSVKTKSQKVLGANSYVSRIYREKTGKGRLFESLVECFNFDKTELVIFKYTRKVLSDEIKIKLGAKMIYLSNSVKYLDVRIDKFLHWHDPVNNILVKLNRDNALLLKIRNCIKIKTLRISTLQYSTLT